MKHGLLLVAALAPAAIGCKCGPPVPTLVPEKNIVTEEQHDATAPGLRTDSERRAVTAPEMDFVLELPKRWVVKESSEEDGGGATASHPSGVKCFVVSDAVSGARLDEIVERVLEHSQEMPTRSWGNLGASRAIVTLEEWDGYRIEHRIVVRNDRYLVMTCEFENFTRPLNATETSAALTEAWRAVTFLPTAGEDPTWQKARESEEQVRAAKHAVIVDERARTVSIRDMTYRLAFPEGWRVQKMFVRDQVGFFAVHERTGANCEAALSPSKGRTAEDVVRGLVEQNSPANDPKFSDGKLGDTPAKVVRFDIGGTGEQFAESRVVNRADKTLIMTCSHRADANQRANAPGQELLGPTETRDAVSEIWRAVRMPAK